MVVKVKSEVELLMVKLHLDLSSLIQAAGKHGVERTTTSSESNLSQARTETSRVRELPHKK